VLHEQQRMELIPFVTSEPVIRLMYHRNSRYKIIEKKLAESN